MTAMAEHIIAEIAEAFPAERDRWIGPLAVRSCPDDEALATARAFADKTDWRALDAAWLDRAPEGHRSALSFMTDAARCFFLPAYLTADLRGELAQVSPRFCLTYGFDAASRGEQPRRPTRPGTEAWARACWSRLTQPQAAAVAHYLEWFIWRERPRIAWEAPSRDAISAREALGHYWYERVGSGASLPAGLPRHVA